MTLKLKSAEVVDHDEADIYGTPYSFTFEDGELDAEITESYRLVIVRAKVGGKLQSAHENRNGVVTTMRAAQILYVHGVGQQMDYSREPEVPEATSILESDKLPTRERIEELSFELAQLACGEISGPYPS